MDEDSVREPANFLNGKTMLKLLHAYIPEQLTKYIDKDKLGFSENGYLKNDGAEELQRILDNSDQKLRMYGSGKELAENLKIFKDFTRSAVFFNFDQCHPYSYSPNIIRSETGDMFIARNDIVVMIQTFLFSEYKFLFNESGVPNPSICVLLKDAEAEMLGYYELIPYKQEEINDILKEIRDEIVQAEKQAKTVVDSYSPEFLLASYKKAYPNVKDIPENAPYDFILNNIRIPFFVYAIGRAVLQRPFLFRSWMEQETSGKKLAVRRFHDNGKEYFIIADIDQIRMCIEKNPAYLNTETSYLYTITRKEADIRFGDFFKYVHIVPVEILRAKHSVQPIPVGFGHFVIPACDALIQILRQVIHVYKVFQKGQIEAFEKFIELLSCSLLVDQSEGRHYFYREESYRHLERRVADHFAPLEGIPAKDVRNAKADGFTLQNLKNELTHLGLTTTFPNIADYAELVYDELCRSKREEYLRTCDLFDGIEQCQRICIFYRYPKLRKFMHDQNGCHRFSVIACAPCMELCPKEVQERVAAIERQNAEKEKEHQAECKVYPYKGVRLEKSDDVNNTEIHWKIICPDGLELYHNFSLYSIDELHELTNAKKIKYFIFDKSELEYAQQHKGQKETLSLKDFSKRPRNMFYLRMFSLNGCESYEVVFSDEVVEILSVITKSDLDTVKKNFDSYGLDPILDITRLEFILNSFDVDKSLITIVPDPFFLVSRHQMIREAGFPTMNVINPDGDVVMHNDQAIFHIFQTVAARIEWSKEYCGKHVGCMAKFEKLVLDTMMDYIKLEPTAFVTRESVEKKVKYLQSMCCFQSLLDRQEETWLYELFHKTYDEYSGIETSERHLAPFYTSSRRRAAVGGNVKLDVWEARLELINRFCDNTIFDGGYSILVSSLQQSTMFKVALFETPESFNPAALSANPHTLSFSVLKETASLKGVKPQYRPEDVSGHSNVKTETLKKNLTKITPTTKVEEAQPSSKLPEQSLKPSSSFEDPKALPTPPEKEKNVKPPPTLPEQTSKPSSSSEDPIPSSTPSEKKEDVKQQSALPEQTVKVSQSFLDLENPTTAFEKKEDVKQQSALPRQTLEVSTSSGDLETPTTLPECTKCTSQDVLNTELKTIRSEFKTAQNEIKNLNSQSAKCQTQIKSLTTQLAAHSNCPKEIKSLKDKVKKGEEREKKLKDTNKGLTDSKEQFKKKVVKLESDAARANETRKKLNKKVSDLEAEVKAEKVLRDRNLEAEKMKHAVEQSRLENEVIERNREFQKLQEVNYQLSIKSEEKDRMIQELSDRLSTITKAVSHENESKIKVYQNLLKTSKDELRKSRRMAERLASKTTREVTRQIANYESTQFEMHLQRYMECLGSNIQKIRETDSCANLPPLPTFPSFSSRFLEEYWKLGNEAEEPSEPEPEPDMECLICHEDMKKNEENLMQCQECTRFYHFECVADWLHRNRTCPVCKKTLLDPNEFPKLG